MDNTPLMLPIGLLLGEHWQIGIGFKANGIGSIYAKSLGRRIKKENDHFEIRIFVKEISCLTLVNI